MLRMSYCCVWMCARRYEVELRDEDPGSDVCREPKRPSQNAAAPRILQSHHNTTLHVSHSRWYSCRHSHIPLLNCRCPCVVSYAGNGCTDRIIETAYEANTGLYSLNAASR
ncbi:hypothetical protein CC86DRAFT_68159 [Ophiobolus disseminans]|uniref:Uncharacterized protein n=1 Tax=Ophiobolus disseminans TaxID=1469910 RepID=A0A6A6ZT07_9PLEO|nr:hypothetical protein CC86DRAFT_68159 [Ophiobolus disseminans]